ncbi:MAG: CoA transferase [Dehalococcoidia bacterium]|nr:CoA transferase [Dehalococcoidia bacterium]
MTGPCDDIRIIDLSSGRAAGIATMVLGDFGADVIKVEPPGGDLQREDPSWPLWMRGKRSITLDLTTAADQAMLHGLVASADVVVSSSGLEAAEAQHTDYGTLSALNAGLVYCAVTPWGLHGPYASWPGHDEALVAAKAGRYWSFANVARREGPSFGAVQVGTHAAGQAAVAGILSALEARDRTGLGQMIETSVLQGMIPFEGNLLRVQMERKHPERMATEAPLRFTPTSLSTLGYQPVLTKDGKWIQFANLLEHLFQASIIALDLTVQVFGDPRYEGAPNRVTDEAREEIRNMMLVRAREKTAAEWMAIFRQHEDVAADEVGTAQDALYHPDLVGNGEVIEQQHPRLGTIRMAGPIIKLRGTPAIVGAPAPGPGQHTAEVLAAPWQARAPRPVTPDARPPLDGVTILEFATIIATPLACSMLADLGARVIKVEPIGGDPGRGLARNVGIGSYIGATRLNANKESICVDLKSEHGQSIVRGLIAKADMIVHNYRPGVPERLGIGYEQANAIRPGIIWLNLSGYGPDGPSAFRPGAHPIPGAVNGGALMQAGEGWPPPASDDIEAIREASRQFTRANESNPDPCSTMAIQTAALLALRARSVTGKGQQAFVSMLSANQYANADDALSYAGKPARPTLDAALMGTGPLRRLYRTSEGWVLLSAQSDEQFATMCSAVGRAALAVDVRFLTADARTANRDALAAEIEALFASKPADEWERSLIAAGIGCVRADGDESSGHFWTRDEQVAANGLAPIAHHPVLGDYQRWGPVVTFARNPGRYGGGTLAGQQTDDILGELGFGADAVADLRARNVVWSEVPIAL